MNRRHLIILLIVVLLLAVGGFLRAVRTGAATATFVVRDSWLGGLAGRMDMGDESRITKHEARPALRGQGRGHPWINLRDGRALSTTFIGATGLPQALNPDQARPLALASADFDEDGVPDLVSGYATSSGGLVILHRGNLHSIYPNHPGANGRHGDTATWRQKNSPRPPVSASPRLPLSHSPTLPLSLSPRGARL